MKKKLLISFSLIAFAGITWYLSTQIQQESKLGANERKPLRGPAYFEYIQELKGTPPIDIKRIWARSTVFNKNQPQMLSNIEELGPFNIGGRTRGLVLDKNNANKMYGAGISGGLWISENAGRRWAKVNDYETSLNITFVAQSPFDPNIIYYTTGEGIGNSSAAPGDGIFKSTDGGITFTQLPATLSGPFNATWRVVHSLTDANTIFVSTNSSGIYRSTDAGQSFERVYVTSRRCQDLEVFSDGSVMATVDGLGVFWSADGSSGSFTPRNTGLPAQGVLGRSEIAYCPTSPDDMYVAVANNGSTQLLGVYRSNNRGINWTQVVTNPTTIGARFDWAWYCLTMHVKHDDPNSLILGSVNGCFTRNGGNSWSIMNYSWADWHIITWHPDKANKVYVGNDGGVYEYDWSNLATRNVDLNWTYNVTQYYAGSFGPNGNTVIAGAQDNGTNLSINSNDTFDRIYGADGSYCHIHKQNNQTAYISWQNGNLRRFNDYKAANPVSTPINNDLDADQNGSIDDGSWFINPFEMHYWDGDLLFFPARRRLHRSTMRGDLWEPVTNNLIGGDAYCVGLSLDMDPTVYIGGTSGLLYRVDKAKTTSPGSEVNLKSKAPNAVRSSTIGHIKVHPLNKGTILIGLTDYSTNPRIWMATDADTENPVFTNVSGNLPSSLPVNFIEIDPLRPDSAWYIATDFGLYYTNDAGANWYKDLTVPNVVVDMVRLRYSDRRLFVFTHGRGVFTGLLFPNGSASHIGPVMSLGNQPKLQAISAFPNPAVKYIQVEFDRGADQATPFTMYNLSGQEVWRGSLRSGQRLQVGTDWKNGTYLLVGEGMAPFKILINR